MTWYLAFAHHYPAIFAVLSVLGIYAGQRLARWAVGPRRWRLISVDFHGWRGTGDEWLNTGREDAQHVIARHGFFSLGWARGNVRWCRALRAAEARWTGK